MSEDQGGVFGSGEDSSGPVRRPAPAPRPATTPNSSAVGPSTGRDARLALLRREVEALESLAASAEEASLLARKHAAEERIRENSQGLAPAAHPSKRAPGPKGRA